MLATSILIPFLALLLPFQDTALDDPRAIRLGPRALAVNHNRRGMLSGIVLASVFVGHRLFRGEMYGYPLDPVDATAAPPPIYVEERLSEPYTSSLLRTMCIAQNIPAPPAPTCINKGVKPNFEYAEKSPAPPAFPVHRQTCSLQVTPIFVDVDMTLLHPPTNPNILVFPEPAHSTVAVSPCLGSSNTLIAIVMIAFVKLAGLLATFFTLIMIWVGLVAIVVFRPSVYPPTVNFSQEVEDVELDSVVSIPESENGQEESNVINCQDKILAKECRFEESPEEIIPCPASPSLSSVSPVFSSTVFEPPTPPTVRSSVYLGSPVASPIVFEPSIFPARSDSDDMPELVDVSSMTTAPELVAPLASSLPSDMDLFVPSISLGSPALSSAVCEHSPLPAQESSLPSQGSPVFSPAVFRPPLLLVQDSASFAIGSPILAPAVFESNIPTPVSEVPLLDAKPSSVTLPTLDPAANTFTPHSLHSSIHAPAFHLAVTTSLPILKPTASASASRSLHSSVHAPVFQPTLPTPSAPKPPKYFTLPALNPPVQSFPSGLRSSMHAPISQPTLSPLRTSEHRPALNPAAQPFLSGLRSCMRSPVSPPVLSPPRAPEHRPALNLVAHPFPSRLRSSMHAPVSPPIFSPPRVPERCLALNPTARPFLPDAPKFFTQARSARVTIVPPPSKKRRVRSPQMKERKAAQRAAREAAAAGEAGEAYPVGEGGAGGA